MKSVIMCEGKTDAILLSYYLGKVYGWKFINQPPKGCEIKDDVPEESLSWYKNNSDYLLICAVGGNTNFGTFYHKKLEQPIKCSNIFQNIIIITDHDDLTIEEIERNINNLLGEELNCLKNDTWVTTTYYDSFSQEKSICVLLKIIPTQYEGALETIMLDAISEDPYDKNIVDQCKKFVNDIRPVADKYIGKNRSALKAQLGVTWAIQSPEKVFTRIDEQIRSVPWERSDILKECFEKLSQLTS